MFKREITVPAAIENLEAVPAFVDGCLEELSCSPRSQMQIAIAVDELFSNIAYYAYPEKTGEVTVRLEAEAEPTAVALTFIDTGIAYDPLSKKDPDLTLSAQERQIGGLGIYMVKKTMDSVSYSFQDGKNILKIVKRI